MEAGLGLPLQPAEEEVFPAPAENAVGDDLPHRGVILRLLPGEKGMVVQNELAEVVQVVGDPHLPAQFGFQRLAVYHKNLFHSVHLLSNGFLSVSQRFPGKGSYRRSSSRSGKTKMNRRELTKSRKG